MSKPFKIPNTLVLLFIMQVAALVVTWILPAGEFETRTNAEGRELVIPGTFYLLDESPSLSPIAILTAIPRGLTDAQDIIFFVLLVGGVLSIIRHTGAIEALLGRVLQRFSARTGLLIFFPMLAFALGSSTFGMAVEFITLVGLLISFCLALRLDRMVAVAVLVVGYGIGYGAAAINPFTVMVAQDVAELQPGSGIWLRLLIFMPLLLLGFHHVYRYAKRVKVNPSLSLVADLQDHNLDVFADGFPEMTRTRVMVLLAMVLAIITLVFGVMVLRWYLTELSALFLALGFAVVLIARLGADESAIALILEDGGVLYTIVQGLSMPLSMVGPELSVLGMLLMQSMMNFFIPSGSGQAYVTMPLMAPLADILGITRQTAVLAYQFGDGFTNMVVPTNPILMGILGVAGIPYDRWLKFILPLMLKILLACSVILLFAVWIGY
jgi:uncharacterized ion transporter superfamily protein YfcC